MGAIKNHMMDMYYEPEKYTYEEFAHWGDTTAKEIKRDARHTQRQTSDAYGVFSWRKAAAEAKWRPVEEFFPMEGICVDAEKDGIRHIAKATGYSVWFLLRMTVEDYLDRLSVFGVNPRRVSPRKSCTYVKDVALEQDW